MKALRPAAILLAAHCASAANALDERIVKDLAPNGTLRVGVVFAPAASAFFVIKEPGTGKPRGVTVDLGTALGKALGVPVEIAVFPNSGEVTEAVVSRAIDVGFMPVDEERKKKVDFGPAYYMIESTYLVRGDSDIRSVADANRAGVKIAGIANTTTIRAAARTAPAATVTAAATVDTAMAMLRDKEADAVALSRDSFATLMGAVPGSRIVDGGFQQTGIAIAVAKGRPEALAAVSAFLEDAKRDGTVRRALDAAGFKGEAVAPPAP